MCVRICECNNCYKRKTCTDCPYVPDAPECHATGVQGCKYRVPYPDEAAMGKDYDDMTTAERLVWWAENCDRCNNGCQVKLLLLRAAAELEAAQREEGQDGESAPTGARKPTTL